MNGVNRHWYSQNADRGYPLDDRATLADAAGGRLPPGLLADLSLHWPADYGRYAFLSAAAVTPSLATLVVQVTDAPDGSAPAAAVAALSVPRPAARGRVYALTPLAEGVSGWAAFGPYADDATAPAYSGRFEPAAGLLSPRAARAYDLPGLLGVRAGDSGRFLTGLVSLAATEPLAVTAERRTVDGREVLAVVIGLRPPTVVPGTPPDVADVLGPRDVSVFREFAGPCGGRPEGRTCADPPPLESVAGVPPDCDGVVTVRFSGCASVRPSAHPCGALVACGVDFPAVCPPRLSDLAGHVVGTLPTPDGLLPSEVAEDLPADDAPPGGGGGPAPALVTLPASGLPYLLCCDRAGDLAYASLVRGELGVDDDASPADPCGAANDPEAGDTATLLGYVFRLASAADLNLVVAPDVGGSVDRLGEVHFKLTAGPNGALHNAQAVFDYAADPQRYFCFEADYDGQALRLLRFDGRRFTELQRVNNLNLRLDRWYALSWRCEAVGDGTAHARGTIVSLDDFTVNALSDWFVLPGAFHPGTGRCGFGSRRAVTRVNHLALGVA